jgi:DNA-binding CsgD family transcriptional regulator
LTKKEREILALVTEGKSNKEIARILAIAVHTIEKHLDNMYKKLNVNNRTSAANIYTRYNLEK